MDERARLRPKSVMPVKTIQLKHKQINHSFHSSQNHDPTGGDHRVRGLQRAPESQVLGRERRRLQPRSVLPGAGCRTAPVRVPSVQRWAPELHRLQVRPDVDQNHAVSPVAVVQVPIATHDGAAVRENDHHVEDCQPAHGADREEMMLFDGFVVTLVILLHTIIYCI